MLVWLMQIWNVGLLYSVTHNDKNNNCKNKKWNKMITIKQ